MICIVANMTHRGIDVTFCILVPGFTNCNLGPHGEDTYSLNVSGFDVDMFRQVAQLAGFVEDVTAADTPVSSNRYVFK